MVTLATTGAKRANLGRAALIGALGVVYGDIGTSPLYAFKEAMHSAGNVDTVRPIVLGCASLIFWALVIVVSVKYVLIVMRATNDEEGGIMALTALASNCIVSERWQKIAILVGLVGVALFYGDAMITPAISVLSAVEGLGVETSVFKPVIVPLSASILAALFILQSRGTANIGKLFGPIMFLWFAVIGAAGIWNILREPSVFAALNPAYGLYLVLDHGWIGFHVLGSIFLAVTGAEALYADEGHFTRKAIRFDWFSLVLPGLLFNYFGQAALLLHRPTADTNPFYLLFPSWAHYPAVALATAATVIASQAVISGAFTMSQQAMLLGYLPRMEVRFTSKTEASQIYIPQVNLLLAFAVIALVLGFGSSDALAGAYGVAVSTTMLTTTLLVGVVARIVWKWSLLATVAVIAFFFIIDLAFFSANIVKILEGGYVPILAGIGVLIAMTTWYRGRSALLERIAQDSAPLEGFWEEMECSKLPRVPGTAIYLTSRGDRLPPSLKLNVKHNKCLHETVILLTVIAEKIPRVMRSKRVLTEPLEHGFRKVTLRYGFAETPNVPRSLQRALDRSVDLGFMMNGKDVSYFVGRAIPVASGNAGLPAWREPIFVFLSNNTTSAANFFSIPPEQVVELGTFVAL